MATAEKLIETEYDVMRNGRGKRRPLGRHVVSSDFLFVFTDRCGRSEESISAIPAQVTSSMFAVFDHPCRRQLGGGSLGCILPRGQKQAILLLVRIRWLHPALAIINHDST
jgi:hypothetical protein